MQLQSRGTGKGTDKIRTAKKRNRHRRTLRNGCRFLQKARRVKITRA